MNTSMCCNDGLDVVLQGIWQTFLNFLDMLLLSRHVCKANRQNDVILRVRLGRQLMQRGFYFLGSLKVVCGSR